MITVYNEEDYKNVGEYDANFNKVAKIHKYWSRKPFHLVEDCILRYSKKGQLVVDPFCGSGSTGLGAILNGRKYIGYDLNPTAVFITESTLNLDFSLEQFKLELADILGKCKEQIMPLYQCGEDQYILYAIVGKNEKDYNAVISDVNFKKKGRLMLPNEFIQPCITIPDNLIYPDQPFPKKFYKDRFSYKGVSNVSDLFTKRNLLSLAILYNYIESSDLKYKDLFRLSLSNTILHVSKLKGENVRPLGVNNYWIPDDWIEENVIWRFADRAKNVAEAKKQILLRADKKGISKTNYKLFNKSSINLEALEDNSVDYIITDPPYGDAIQYSELSYVWNCWLKTKYEIEQEVIINPVQDKGTNEFQLQIQKFIDNAHRVIKNNGRFTLCFQNKDIKIWLNMILHIKSAGFLLEDIRIYDTFGSPYNKHWAKFSPKADLYVTFKKSSKRIKQSGSILPETIINEIVNQCDISQLDMNHCYDIFVAHVIKHVFDGYEIIDADKWNLKQIVNLYEQKLRVIEGGNS
jgi:DNA modification methylase